jgi:cobalt-zinc-cadmium efflux system outer membrane protein
MDRTIRTLAILLAITCSVAASARHAGAGERPFYPLPAVHEARSVQTAAFETRQPVNAGAITIEELQQLALANNPTYAQAARRIDAFRGEHLQVGLRPNPLIGYEGEDMGEGGFAGQHGMFVEQRLITGGKLDLNRAVVSHDIDRAQQELEIQRLRILNDVKSRAYDTLVAQQIVEMNQQLVEIGNSALRAAETLFKSQEVGQVDVLQARIEANSARLDLNTAQNEFQSAWRRLTLAVGIPDMPLRPLANTLNEGATNLTWEGAAERLLAESPELASAWAGVERARCALARAQAGRAPDLDLAASVRYSDESDSTLARVGVGMPLQIFDRNQGNICKAQAELTQAHREVERVQLVLQDRLADVFKQYLNARQETEQYKTVIVPDAKASLQLVQSGYQQGEFGFLELLTAQRTYTRVSLASLHSARQLFQSQTQVEGLLLTGALDAPNR